VAEHGGGGVVEELFAVLGLKVDHGSFHKGEAVLEHAKHALELVGLGLGLHEVYEMVKGVSELADHAVKAGQSLGITAEAVQGLGYAAKITDVSQEDLEIGLKRLAVGLNEVATKGKGPAADALKALGVSASELKGQSLDQSLETIADAFQKLPDGPKKTAAAVDLFGRSGARLIPLLNQGKAGIDDLRAEAERLGIVVSSETAKKFEEFNDQQKRLSATLQGLKVQVISALLPAFQHMVEGIRDWVAENRELIKSAIEVAVQVTKAIFTAIGKFVAAIADGIKWLQHHKEVAQALLLALGALITAFAVQAAIDWALALGPIALVIAALTGLILLVRRVVDAFRDGIPSIGELLHKLGVGGSIALGLLLGPLTPIIAAILLIKQGIEYLIEKWDRVKEIAGEALQDVGLGAFDPEKVKREHGGAGGGPASTAAATAAAASVAPSVAAPAGGTAVTNTFGDTNIEVKALPGMDAKAVADMTSKQIEESKQSQLFSAYEILRGGRR